MANDGKHTAGPWHERTVAIVKFDDGRQEECAEIGAVETDETIAYVPVGFRPSDEANARLIAAAPETAAERDRLAAALRTTIAHLALSTGDGATCEDQPHFAHGDDGMISDGLAVRLARAALAGTIDPTAALRESNAELLAALRELVADVRQAAISETPVNASVIADARAAIAKAEGR